MFSFVGELVFINYLIADLDFLIAQLKRKESEKA
jgi:hypothetical protein